MSIQQRHFVIGAGTDKSHVYRIISFTAKSAHEMAAREYRKANNLASSVYVRTATLFDSDDEATAVEFTKKLLEELEKYASERSGDQRNQSGKAEVP